MDCSSHSLTDILFSALPPLRDRLWWNSVTAECISPTVHDLLFYSLCLLQFYLCKQVQKIVLYSYNERILKCFNLFFQAAHQEIKSHGQTIKSIVSICEQFSSSCSSSSSVSKRSQFYGKGPPQRQSSLVVTPGGDNFSNNNNCLRGEDVGRSIERRWHCLWLRSLEWQCYLEQLTWTPNIKKKVRHN